MLTRGHALVIPRVHSADLMEIGEQDLEATTLAAQRLAKRMKDVLGADGINLINACGAAAWRAPVDDELNEKTQQGEPYDAQEPRRPARP